ncbi:MAG: T9SS type A sorting domain-containing protein [Saprospiraceae bacterium]|nr:T9SS type A sorting domain-containing protein [Saprospiraceae bacterium]
MKHLYFIALFAGTSLFLGAQSCLPDSTLVDSSAGVYPKPITESNPNGGINKKACINKPYEFTFTVVVPDTVEIPILPAPIPLEKVAIDTVGAISNLPAGLSYHCNPPNCVFNKNQIGCLLLQGTPTDANAPGEYKPIIKLKLTVNVGISFDYTTEYPGAAFPGEYILTLLSEQDCASANQFASNDANYWFPNPVSGSLLFNRSNPENVRIYDASGKLLLQKHSLNNGNLVLPDRILPGVYWIHSSLRGYPSMQKLVVIH